MKKLMWCCGAFAALAVICLILAGLQAGNSIMGMEHSISNTTETFTVLYPNGTGEQYEKDKQTGAVLRSARYWRRPTDGTDLLFLSGTLKAKPQNYIVVSERPFDAPGGGDRNYQELSMYRYPSPEEMKQLEQVKAAAGTNQ